MEVMVAMEAMEVMDTEVTDTEVIIMERGQLMQNLKQKLIHGTVMVDMEAMDMAVMDMVALEVMEDMVTDMGVMVVILARGPPMPNLKHGMDMEAMVDMGAMVDMEDIVVDMVDTVVMAMDMVGMDTMDKGECNDHHYINHHCPPELSLSVSKISVDEVDVFKTSSL